MSIIGLITYNFTEFHLDCTRWCRFTLPSHVGKKANAAEEETTCDADYITNIMHICDWCCVRLSLSASFLQKTSVATGCLCQIAINGKLLREYESCVNFRVKAQRCKWNCVKWDLSIISTYNRGCSSPRQLWNNNNIQQPTNQPPPPPPHLSLSTLRWYIWEAEI